MIIYDRWGNKIFESNDIQKGWDGKGNYNGKMALEDVYVWKIFIMNSNNETFKYVGQVNLIR